MRRQFLWQLATCSEKKRNIKQRHILANIKDASANLGPFLGFLDVLLYWFKELEATFMRHRLDSLATFRHFFILAIKLAGPAGLFTAVSHCQLMSGNGRTSCHIRH